jgi:hypothetical protein
MLYGKKPASIERVVSDRIWNQVRPLLDLPEHACNDFEMIVTNYLQMTEYRERLKSASSVEAFLWSELYRQRAWFTDDECRDLVSSFRRVTYPRVCGHKSVERTFVRNLAEIIEHHTGERPNHGKKWLSKLTKACALIDPEITSGTVEGALRGHRNRL